MTISSAVSAGISFMRFLSYYGRPQISIREAGTPRHRERAKVGAAMLLDRLKLFCSFGVEIYIQYVYYSGPGGEDVAFATNRSTIATTATTSFARLTTSGPSPTLTMHHPVYPL